jgi:hypothetical protein
MDTHNPWPRSGGVAALWCQAPLVSAGPAQALFAPVAVDR